jgi:hypothetical protein
MTWKLDLEACSMSRNFRPKSGSNTEEITLKCNKMQYLPVKTD